MTASRTTEGVQRLMTIIGGATANGSLPALDAALLGAGLAASVEEDQRVLSPRRLGVTRSTRRMALLLLAERREVFYPATVRRLVRVLARESRFDVDASFELLTDAIDTITGLEDGRVDPVDVLGAGVPGTVQAKAVVVESDAEQDADRALSQLLATARPPRRDELDPGVVSLAARRQSTDAAVAR